MSTGRPTALLLNAGHALDHLFLLIFATAVGAIAADWGMIWQDLMPFAAGAFVMFGLGSLLHRHRRLRHAGLAHRRRVDAGGCAHAHGRLLVDLSPGGHPDAGAAL